MSASEMERLKADNERLREQFANSERTGLDLAHRERAALAESASLRERLREAEHSLKALRTDKEEWMAAYNRAQQDANDAEAAKSQALEALRNLLREDTGTDTDDGWATPTEHRARLALSGSSAPQAPDPEFDELLDEIGAGLGCTPYLDGGAIERAEAALSKLRAALSMKSEGSADER